MSCLFFIIKVLKRLLSAVDRGVPGIGCSEKGTEREIDNLLLLAPPDMKNYLRLCYWVDKDISFCWWCNEGGFNQVTVGTRFNLSTSQFEQYLLKVFKDLILITYYMYWMENGKKLNTMYLTEYISQVLKGCHDTNQKILIFRITSILFLS